MNPEIFEKSWWIKEGKPDPREYTQILAECGFNVLRYVAHHFDPSGYTGLWLLAESHAACHSWPEHGLHYFQLSSCNEDMFNKFDEMMKERTK